MTFEEKALAAGGHLADDVAAVVCGGLVEFVLTNVHPELRETLVLEDTALD